MLFGWFPQHKVEQKHSPTLCPHVATKTTQTLTKKGANEGIPHRFGYVIHQIYPFPPEPPLAHLFALKTLGYLAGVRESKKKHGETPVKKAMQPIW